MEKVKNRWSKRKKQTTAAASGWKGAIRQWALSAETALGQSQGEKRRKKVPFLDARKQGRPGEGGGGMRCDDELNHSPDKRCFFSSLSFLFLSLSLSSLSRLPHHISTCTSILTIQTHRLLQIHAL